MAASTLRTSGSDLLDVTDHKIILRGINLPLLDDWNFPGHDKLADLETSGANCVRIQWYVDYGNPDRPAYSFTDLDGFLTRCRTIRVLPILGLWDLTCQDNTNRLNTELIPWWTNPDVVAILKAHEDFLIINLANELGVYHWSADAAKALTAYCDAYITAVDHLRKAGLKMPIMIDAPDCGTSLDAFTTILDPVIPTCVGQQLIDADSLHNIVLSAHAYWAAADHTASVNDAIALELPFVLGEIANKQSDGAGDECHFGIDGTGINVPAPSGFQYQSLLKTLKDRGIGWLAWAWSPDSCLARNVATYDAAGTFIGLTTYGDDVVNNIEYGLKTTAVRF
jgi:mannan endo-1,4-beta-mannosidase